MQEGVDSLVTLTSVGSSRSHSLTMCQCPPTAASQIGIKVSAAGLGVIQSRLAATPLPGTNAAAPAIVLCKNSRRWMIPSPVVKKVNGGDYTPRKNPANEGMTGFVRPAANFFEFCVFRPRFALNCFDNEH